ncbi:unnamed protein product [Psylliodes chrysocephalus]|uniref:Decaprenyl-diphosphate synthase subunit 2 n=1 Tax=Psylliodes chrysocephalus TaxID=3402493 RepID=A0A9P0CMA1_9CUCU|nr:unnamed protein product [Psylliodes chrysocephala]
MMNNISIVFKNVSKLRYLKRSSLFILSVRHNHLNSNKAISYVENIVGCSVPVFDLKWLPEVDLESHFRKLIGSQHPITNAIREISLDESLSWSLITLLVSKAAVLSENSSKHGNDLNPGIFQKQMVLATITEMIRISNIFHKNIINIHKDDYQKHVSFGNTLSLLIGDYLESETLMQLASLKCNKVLELVISTFRDVAEAEFIEPQDGQSRPLPASPLSTKEKNSMPNHLDQDIFVIEEILGNAKAEWIMRHVLGGASLLAKSCQAAMMLADHSEELEQSAYTIGRSIALSQQLQKDISNYKSTEFGPFSLISAPMMFYIQDNVDFYQTLMENVEKDDINYNEIRNLVINGNAIEKSLELKDEFVLNGMEALNQFPENKAKNALINILQSI